MARVQAECFRQYHSYLIITMTMMCLLVAAEVFLPASIVKAQPLSLTVTKIDGSRLPRLTIRAAMYRNGLQMLNLEKAAITLTENGKPMKIDIECPDSTKIANSIALVLDNSSSMMGNTFKTLIAATSEFADSLRPNDAAMVVCFGESSPYILQPLTVYKPVLKASLSKMPRTDSTRLWSASLLAIQNLSNALGKRVCIIFSDGIDNASTVGPDDVLAEAKSLGVALYTIYYGDYDQIEKQLAKLAYYSGGKFYHVGRDNSAITKAFMAIAAEIKSVECAISWTAENCSDSLRDLHLEARLEDETAVWDSLWHSPVSKGSITMRVVAQSEVDQVAEFPVYVAVDPVPTPDILTTYRFILHYNEDLLGVDMRRPVTGELTPPSRTELTLLGNGRLLVQGIQFMPQAGTDILVGINLYRLNTDSSRRVRLAIDSVVFEGCPVTAVTIADTVEVCQCREPLIAWLDPVSYAIMGKELNVQLRVLDTVWHRPVVYDAAIYYDAERLTPLRIETDSSVSNEAHIEWVVPEPGKLFMTSSVAFSPVPSDRLATVVFSAQHSTKSDSCGLRLPYVKAYSRCCPEAVPDKEGYAVIEGMCDRIVQRVQAAALHQNVPNPVSRERGWTSIPYTVTASGRVVINIYDAMGRKVLTVLDCEKDAGEYAVDVATSGLSAGEYTILLGNASRMIAAKKMIVQ
jgi:Mg-chelatase subunit ChlD